MVTTFDIRLKAIQDHYRQDRDPLRYKRELEQLLEDIERVNSFHVMKSHPDEEITDKSALDDVANLHRLVKVNML